MPPAPDRPKDQTSLRRAAVKNLIRRRERGTLTSDLIRQTAKAHGVHPVTIKNWIKNADAHDGIYTPKGRKHYAITEYTREVIAEHRGRVSEAYRYLKRHPKDGEPKLPERATFYRAVTRDIARGDLAGWRHGEEARRRYEVRLKRPKPTARNEVWESDHVQADVLVDVDGYARKPWITWAIDCAHNVVPGLAVTPHQPNTGAIFVMARDALLRTAPHSRFGGLPQVVRVDRGKDYLSIGVAEAFGGLAIEIDDLPPRRPDLKGTIENLNNCVKEMLLCTLPGFTDAALPSGHKPLKEGQSVKPGQLMTLEQFVQRLRKWVHWWNHQHTPQPLNGLTPAQSWAADLTPIDDVDPEELHTYTQLHHKAPRKITPKGVTWRSGHYIEEWMYEHQGRKVTLRYMPHHNDHVELYDYAADRYLGHATLVDKLPEERRKDILKARRRHEAQLKRELKRVQDTSMERFEAMSEPGAPKRLDAITRDQADRQRKRLGLTPEDDTITPQPMFRPPTEPTAIWYQPGATAPQPPPPAHHSKPPRPAAPQPPAPTTATAPTPGPALFREPSPPAPGWYQPEPPSQTEEAP